MTDAHTVTDWVDAYRAAWETNAPDNIRALFTDDAHYLHEPDDEPEIGHNAIIAGWLESRDEPGTTTWRWELIGLDGDRAFVRGFTDYLDTGKLYSNLWVIDFAPDGRVSSFTEWWVKRPGSA